MLVGILFVVMGLITAWTASQKKLIEENFVHPKVSRLGFVAITCLAVPTGVAAVILEMPKWM
jgi:hypothetical protein